MPVGNKFIPEGLAVDGLAIDGLAISESPVEVPEEAVEKTELAIPKLHHTKQLVPFDITHSEGEETQEELLPEKIDLGDIPVTRLELPPKRRAKLKVSESRKRKKRNKIAKLSRKRNRT